MERRLFWLSKQEFNCTRFENLWQKILWYVSQIGRDRMKYVEGANHTAAEDPGEFQCSAEEMKILMAGLQMVGCHVQPLELDIIDGF